MSATATPTCPLGLTADSLSAWRDQALPAADERHITSHVATCRACQRVIAAHESLAGALQADQPPAPDPRNWSRLRQRIASARPAARFAPRSFAPRWRRAAVWSGLGAVAAALVISALFFSLFGQLATLRGGKTSHNAGPVSSHASLPAVAPTRSMTGTRLAWRSYAAPDSAVPPPGNDNLVNGFGFAPSDPQTAYICSSENITAPNPVTIWATHNGARSWAQVDDLSHTDLVSECIVTVDALDPLRLNLLFSGQSLTTLKPDTRSYVSVDGGKTWRALSDDVQLVGLATRGQTSVAVVTPYEARAEGSTPAKPIGLAISHDGFRTWTVIDGSLVARGLTVENVWQRPSDGALLAMTETKQAVGTTVQNGFPPIVYTLWESADMGAHWTAFPIPANLHGYPGFIVAQPHGADPWRVCGLTLTDRATLRQGELIGCTLDGGQTWTSRPLPLLRTACGGACVQQETLDSGRGAAERRRASRHVLHRRGQWRRDSGRSAGGGVPASGRRQPMGRPRPDARRLHDPD